MTAPDTIELVHKGKKLVLLKQDFGYLSKCRTVEMHDGHKGYVAYMYFKNYDDHESDLSSVDEFSTPQAAFDAMLANARAALEWEPSDVG